MPKCTVFSFANDLPTIVENGLYMRAIVGDELSVGIVKFVAANGADIPAKSHSHGEEASLQIEGGCQVLLGSIVGEGESSVTLEPGALMLMPAGQSHYGVNAFGEAGVSWRLNVVTPPRREFGAKGQETSFYPIDGARK